MTASCSPGSSFAPIKNLKQTNENTDMEDQTNPTGNPGKPADNTPKATGIGGVFFATDNPKETKEWYVKNLGIEVNAWGAVSFDSRNINNPEQIDTLQWSPFKRGDAFFEPSKKEFMINYQVQNIEALVEKLKGNGVTILDSIETYDYGKFIHIMDADGNKLQLWEPS